MGATHPKTAAALPKPKTTTANQQEPEARRQIRPDMPKTPRPSAKLRTGHLALTRQGGAGGVRG